MLRTIGPADREPTRTPPPKHRTTKVETPAATHHLTPDHPAAMSQDREAMRIANRATSTAPAVKVAQVRRSAAIFSVAKDKGDKDKGSSISATASDALSLCPTPPAPACNCSAAFAMALSSS